MISDFILIEQLYVLILAAGLVTAFFFCGHPSMGECLARLEAPAG